MTKTKTDKYKCKNCGHIGKVSEVVLKSKNNTVTTHCPKCGSVKIKRN